MMDGYEFECELVGLHIAWVARASSGAVQAYRWVRNDCGLSNRGRGDCRHETAMYGVAGARMSALPSNEVEHPHLYI